MPLEQYDETPSTSTWVVLEAHKFTYMGNSSLTSLTAYRSDDPMQMVYLFTPVSETLYESDLKHSHEAPFYVKHSSFDFSQSTSRYLHRQHSQG
jgi:hypothetical protein